MPQKKKEKPPAKTRRKPYTDDEYRLFAVEYLKDFNGTEAAKRCPFINNTTDKSYGVTATRLLARASVQALLAEERLLPRLLLMPSSA